MRTIRLVVALGIVALAASVANAATVTISTDKSTYLIGETITLTTSTDSQGESFTNVFAQVSYDGALASVGAPATQTLGTGMLALGSLTTPDIAGAWKTVLNQFAFAPANPGVSIVGTAFFTADAAGTFSFVTGSGQAGQPFQFGSALTGNTASITIVPEPATAAMLGLGLLGLGVAGRRR